MQTDPLPKAVIFDLDETLAPSFLPPEPAMIERLSALLDLMPISIMSGAGFDRISRDILTKLEEHQHVDRLFVFPNSAAQCLVWRDGWNMEYDFTLTDSERGRILSAIAHTIEQTPEANETPFSGERIVDRGAQIALTLTGTGSSPETKRTWDPDGSKRRSISKHLISQLPDFDVLIGGATTIDITRKGVNKAYGVRFLAEYLHLHTSDMLYVGDALFEGGNDAVVIPTGVRTQRVSGPNDTASVIDAILKGVATQ